MHHSTLLLNERGAAAPPLAVHRMNPKQYMKRILIGVALAVVVAVAGFVAFRPSLSELRSEADSLAGVYSRDTASYAADTLATNADTTARRVIQKERASCGRAIRTCEARVTNYQKQIKALTPTLRLFAEVDAGVPIDLLGTGQITARAGLAVRLKHDLDAQLYGQKPLLGAGQASVHIGIRKYWRLF